MWIVVVHKILISNEWEYTTKAKWRRIAGNDAKYYYWTAQSKRQNKADITLVYSVLHFFFSFYPNALLFLWSFFSIMHDHHPHDQHHHPTFNTSPSLQSSIYSEISICGNLSIWELSWSFCGVLIETLYSMYVYPSCPVNKAY